MLVLVLFSPDQALKGEDRLLIVLVRRDGPKSDALGSDHGCEVLNLLLGLGPAPFSGDARLF